MPTITIFYAGLLGLLGAGLAIACGSIRGRTGIMVGDGENQELAIAMRRQANFVEFAPLVLVLLALLETHGVSGVAIHVMGSVFLGARLCHAFGYTPAHPGHWLRTIGAMLSILTLVTSSIWAVIVAI